MWTRITFYLNQVKVRSDCLLNNLILSKNWTPIDIYLLISVIWWRHNLLSDILSQRIIKLINPLEPREAWEILLVYYQFQMNFIEKYLSLKRNTPNRQHLDKFMSLKYATLQFHSVNNIQSCLNNHLVKRYRREWLEAMGAWIAQFCWKIVTAVNNSKIKAWTINILKNLWKSLKVSLLLKNQETVWITFQIMAAMTVIEALPFIILISIITIIKSTLSIHLQNETLKKHNSKVTLPKCILNLRITIFRIEITTLKHWIKIIITNWI